jgi:serine phosphatase RsbU (regulator of sigma subunit)/anti-sigma regulatory factor (Ser/Thr protein kinase)
MIDETVEFEVTAARNGAPASLLVDDVARMCIAAGADLCAVFAASGELIACEQRGRAAGLRRFGDATAFAEAAEAQGYTLQNEPIWYDGAQRAVAIFGSRNAALGEPLLRSAVTLFSSALLQAERLAHYHRIADRLQRAMLPLRLATADGVRFDAAYSPGSSEAQVGGDWYDAFEIGEGLICVSVGDVTGHGLEAAITMTELRRAIRTATVAHDSPSAALNAVDAIASAQGLGIASALLGFYDPAHATLRYACAGHPVPILLTPQGRGYPLPGGGTLLGLGIGCASPERTVTLSSGTAIVFYTDGLTEYDRDIFAGEARLTDAIETLAAENALEGRALHDLVLPSGPCDDCATLIVARERYPGSEPERWIFSAVPQSARLLRDALRDYTERCGLSEDEQFGVLVAAGEAIANGIEHGDQEPGATIAVDARCENGALQLQIESRGHWRTSQSLNRGRGITIMRSYAKRVSIMTASGNTRISLAF